MPQPFGPYRIEGEIGRGAMGIVYRAHHVELQREVALKVLSDASSPAHVERFRREALAVAKLRHPNIVAVHDAGRIDNVPFIAMELVDGKTLAALVEEKALDLRERVAVLAKVADAVHHAHQRGIVHRDLKPANILVDTAGEPRVLDFGLAHLALATAPLTRSGAVMGTPVYMSPEQASGQVHEIGPATDVWSLGVMLYELLTGHPPFTAPELLELYAVIMTRDPMPPSRRSTQVPRELETVCLHALEKNPHQRYPSAAAFAADLNRWLRGEPVRVRPPSTLTVLRRKLARRRGLVAAAAGVLLAVAVTAAVLSRRVRAAESRATEAHTALLENMRKLTDAYLDAALTRRRAGDVRGMLEYVPKAEQICRECAEKIPAISDPHTRLARVYRAAMRFDKALAELDRALSKDANDLAARYDRGLLRTASYEAHVSTLRDAWKRKEGARVSGRPGVEVRKLPSRRELEDDRARELRRGAEDDLKPVDSPLARGLLAALSDDSAKALELFRSATRETPRAVEAWERLAQLLSDADRTDEAIAVCTEAMKHDQGYTPFLEKRGTLIMSLGSVAMSNGEMPVALFEKSLRDLDEAIRLMPDRADAWLWRGVLRLNWIGYRARMQQDPTDLYESGVVDFDVAHRLEPEREEILLRRGSLLMNWGAAAAHRGEDPGQYYKRAIDDLGRVLKLNPKLADAAMYRAGAWSNWGFHRINHDQDPTEQYTESLKDFDLALALDPARSQPWAMRGNALTDWGAYQQKLGKDPTKLFAQALENIDRALAIDPQDAAARAWRGYVFLYRAQWWPAGSDQSKADWRAARAEFLEAQRIVPQYVDTLRDRLDECARGLGEK
jgi:tetratricopeptide (TPR) repeat protein